MLLGYFTEGGPFWFAATLAAVLAALTGLAGWFSYPPGERLGREWRSSRSAERTRQLGEDGQVGVERDPIQTTDAERG